MNEKMLPKMSLCKINYTNCLNLTRYCHEEILIYKACFWAHI